MCQIIPANVQKHTLPRYQPSMFGCTGSFENGVRGIGSTEISVQPQDEAMAFAAFAVGVCIHIYNYYYGYIQAV